MGSGGAETADRQAKLDDAADMASVYVAAALSILYG